MAATKPSERLLKYPPMERQDLNQSQLGSFKFVPVDRIQSIDAIATNYLRQQLAESLFRAESARLSATKAASGGVASPIQTTSPQSASTDADFFNKHIKPDLAESRLRLGPAALRSAVEGAAKSPTKQGQLMGSRQETFSEQAFQQRYLSVHAQDISHSALENANMDPTAAAFVPTTTLNQSLGLALVNEQEAHNATRAALRKEVERGMQQEEQIVQYQQQISRLTVTVNNLGAIIKHNLSKLGDENAARDKDVDSVKDMEEAALHEFYGSNPHLAKSPESRQEKHEHLACLDSRHPAVSANGMIVKVDETQLYNFELLTSPDDGGSPISALRQTLRKQFSIAEDLNANQSILATPAASRTSVNKLVDISPESAESDKEVIEEKYIAHVSGCSNHEEAGVTKPSSAGAVFKPRLLPAAFVNKYGRKPSTKDQGVLKDQSNGSNKMDLPNPHSLRISDEVEVFSHKGAINNSCESISRTALYDSNGEQSDTAVATLGSTQTNHGPNSAWIQLPGDFYGHPNWLVTKENPIFHSDEEMREAVGDSGIVWINNSPFTTHPVRYLPEDAASNHNAYRTVMIDNIPVGSTPKDVLAHTRGGALQSLQLLPPIGGATSFMTARVVFLFETAADEMRERHQKAPFHVNGAQVRVWKPIDPTYPLNVEVEDAIWGEEEASRILLIGAINDYLFELLPGKLARLDLDRPVIEYSWTWDGYAAIEFADIKSAFRAMRELKKDGDFYGADFRYDRDYTSSKYESLQPSKE
ncbi:hypothetical protein A1O3_08475 [Capronia epimyces CBS 606.96]|uniref:Uncharacterized protein n=1 Tax=Capronia epimyces CBS 606.96 TaxID=1182542 RepID=W9XNS8_9EURO|nr:uncharacterized protein A1O3_08475 [Capronia epimyces CBS 606.96]EXJ78975.1 hypothetical protein A1O3_08475 [Capronia epimyces CBS 606.96]